MGHLTTSVDHLAEFCQNYHLAAICTQLMVKFFLQLRFIQYFDCKCLKIPDFSTIDSYFVALILILGNNGLHQLITTSHLLWVRGNTEGRGSNPWWQIENEMAQYTMITQIARYVGPTLAQRGADRIHVGATWGQWSLRSGNVSF